MQSAGIREKIGDAVGRVWAPAVAAISRARHTRMFHPVGLTFEGRIEAIDDSPYALLGHMLEGRVMARLSAALWKRPLEHFEVLGIALRCRRDNPTAFDARAAAGDQDLLFATIISPWTMPFSPVTTNAHDFLSNRYYAVSPFELVDRDRVKLRLLPLDPSRTDGPRDERLRTAVAEGRAEFLLEARPTLRLGWHPIARVELEREIDVDQVALSFDPFRDGAGITPVGVIHAIRRATYAASQLARPAQ